VVGKCADPSVYDSAAQLRYRHWANRIKQCNGDLDRRRLRAYEPDGLDGSVLFGVWAYSYTHANSHTHRHTYTSPDTNSYGDSHRHA
jgi:hypothetical protein